MYERNREGEGIVIVKIELSEKRNYKNCNMEFEEAEIVGIICENSAKRNAIISLIVGDTGSLGNCILNNIDMQYAPKVYRQMVDYISLDRIDSTLTVKNYLIFYTMVAGVYNSNTVEQLMDILLASKMQQLINVQINALNRTEKIIIRCIAAHLKKVKCLVSDNLFEGLEEEQQDKLSKFLNEFFIRNECICFLFESKRKTLDRIASKIIMI